MNKIKQLLKNIISSVLIITVLLPFAIQFSHSLEKHEHICNAHDLHIDNHELDCSVFHFKVNQNSIDFSSEEILFQNVFIENKIASYEAQIALTPQYQKPSRAPPVLLFS